MRRDAGSRGGPQLSKRKSFDDGFELSAVAVKQDQQGRGSALGMGPSLGAGVPAFRKHCANGMQGGAGIPLDVSLDHVLRVAFGLRQEPSLKSGNGFSHIHHGNHVAFRNPQGGVF